MKSTYTGILIAIVLALICSAESSAKTLTISRGDDLQATINFASDGDTIIIGEKELSANRTEFAESLCGNCENYQTDVDASYGFVIRDKSLCIIGQSRDNTILKTNAGYGLYIENAPQVTIRNLTISGGRRDPDPNATDAAIVAKHSTVHISGLNIINNDHRIDSVVVGISGIIGREGSNLFISDCNIINSGWDGIALYRGASATISDCTIKDGRGAGIGVTWDANCSAIRNKVSGYWKGIGAFGTSWVSAQNNAVFDNLGWGIIATGSAYMNISNNVIYHNGNCGVAPWSTLCHGRIINNIIANNGWREKWVCPCVGVWNFGDWAKWEFSYNIVWGNDSGNYQDIWDQTGINGNLSENPEFLDTLTFIIGENSPAGNAGHPEIYDLDGTRSDLGIYGGPKGLILK